jgi:anti-sigma regulatory factor (Ser/Thr protein kinase)
VVEARAVLPGALAPESFFGRIEELRSCRRQERALARNLGRSRILYARPGFGKTELLRQWHGRLFLEGEFFPFWYAIPRGVRDPAALACDFVAALSLQALAFRRRDPLLLTRPLPRGELAEGLRSTWGDGGALLAEALVEHETASRGPSVLARAALLPHRLAALAGARMLCLIDDGGNLAAAAGGLTWPEEATASPLAPAVFALDDESLLPGIFGPDAASLITFDRLPPLSGEAASRLARHLAQGAGLELDEQALAALAAESAGSPFYLGALVRALAALPGSGPLDVARAAAESLCSGELARYWTDRLAGAIPERRLRATALEILTFCLREGEAGPEAGRLADLMFKPAADVESALAGLAKVGVVRVDCARVAVEDDPVLRDVVRALYRREFGRVAPAAVVAALAADKVRSAPSVRLRLRREALRGVLRAVLGAWDGQRVPAVLFDAAGIRVRHGERGAGGAEGVPGALEGDRETIALPRVISVVSGPVGAGAAFPGLEVDALAWALSAEAVTPEADLAWVARLVPGGAGSADQLVRFDRDIAALQSAGELPPARLERWALLEAPLDADGEAAAARLGFSTSSRPQLEALAKLVGATVNLPPPVSAPPVEPELEMEMVIPRVADVELVAARALEQLAENLSIEAAVIGRLKVALVEACINAFEHGGARDGRVRLAFAVGGGRLVMRVENRGRALSELPSPAARGREARGRGWGLTLIRELVDEVSLEPREDGVSLIMVKNLGRAVHG